MTHRRLTGVLWTLKWFLAVCLLVLCVDLLYVFWPYPDGPRGVAALKANLATEVELIGGLADAQSWAIIQVVADGLYRPAFVWTGLDELTRRAADPTPLSPLNETMRSFVLASWAFLETAAVGLQLFALRIGVLVLAAPLFLVTAVAAGADGLITWYSRRTGAGRESGFIYHRAKRGLALSVLALGLVYLVPPVPLDPRWVIPPFLAIFAAALRVTAAYFKKYL
jgi:integrating conjugative element membrane protein (TIGR03747 family)